MTTRAARDPLAIHLETYEEAWTTGHEEVKRALWAFEDRLAVGLGLFEVIHSRYWTWRDRVVSGEDEYTPEDEQSFKERFECWLRPCVEVLKRLENLEPLYGSVAGAGEFRRKCREAAQILASWEPLVSATEEESEPGESGPRRVADHGLRPLTLENAAEVERIMRPAPESVPLTPRVDDRLFF